MILNNTSKLIRTLHNMIIRICITSLLIFGLTACPIQPWNNFETEYMPVLMDVDELENSIQFIGNLPLENPGKMYYKDSIVFINERYKGVHIIDNHDPSKPVNLGFITIPGSIDIAVKGNVLYADNALDLVSISLANYTEPVVTKRIRNVFPELVPPDGGFIPEEYWDENRPDGTVIVQWIKTR